MSISRWLRIDKNAELSSEGVVVTLAKRAQSLGSVNGQDRVAGRLAGVEGWFMSARLTLAGPMWA